MPNNMNCDHEMTKLIETHDGIMKNVCLNEGCDWTYTLTAEQANRWHSSEEGE